MSVSLNICRVFVLGDFKFYSLTKNRLYSASVETVLTSLCCTTVKISLPPYCILLAAIQAPYRIPLPSL